jgi:hypothetical protein
MSDTDDDFTPDQAFAIAVDGPDDPRPIMQRIVAEAPEFEDLRVGEPAIMVLFRAVPKIKGGKLILGTMSLPAFQGSLGEVATWLLATACGGSLPDYLLILDREWWLEASATEREALIFHELMHCMIALDREGEKRFTDEGDPVWAIRPHDLEEFNAVVRRYGAWKSDIRDFMEALREHGVN